jgi:hypothetical protein
MKSFGDSQQISSIEKCAIHHQRQVKEGRPTFQEGTQAIVLRIFPSSNGHISCHVRPRENQDETALFDLQTSKL